MCLLKLTKKTVQLVWGTVYLALEVTVDEKVHDGKMLKTLLDHVSNRLSDTGEKTIRIESVSADGA